MRCMRGGLHRVMQSHAPEGLQLKSMYLAPSMSQSFCSHTVRRFQGIASYFWYGIHIDGIMAYRLQTDDVHTGDNKMKLLQ